LISAACPFIVRAMKTVCSITIIGCIIIR